MRRTTKPTVTQNSGCRRLRLCVITFTMLTGFIIALAGCAFTNPITGQNYNVGSIRILNNHSSSVSGIELFSGPDGTGDKVWSSSNVSVGSGGDKTVADIPAGTWCVRIGGKYVNDVRVVFGMTTIINRDSGGNLTAGIPVPF